MSVKLLTIVTLIYLGVAYSEYEKGHVGMSVTYVSYAFANIGLIMAALNM